MLLIVRILTTSLLLGLGMRWSDSRRWERVGDLVGMLHLGISWLLIASRSFPAWVVGGDVLCAVIGLVFGPWAVPQGARLRSCGCPTHLAARHGGLVGAGTSGY